MIINYGETCVGVDTEKCGKLKNATYVCDHALKTKGGGWSEIPAQIYWQEKPPVEGYSNYFGIVDYGNGSIYITSGHCIENLDISAIRCGDEVIFSRFRHDFRQSADGKCAIDGGRDYTKLVGRPDEVLTLRFEGPKLVVVPSSAE